MRVNLWPQSENHEPKINERKEVVVHNGRYAQSIEEFAFGEEGCSSIKLEDRDKE